MDEGGRPPDRGEARDGARWRAWLTAASARWAARAAVRAERAALEELGSALARERDATEPGSDPVRAALAAVARRDAAVAALRAALATSLEEDRRDYADASAWLRPLAVVRGMATRALVRDRMRRARDERRQAHVALGSAALDGGGARVASLGAVTIRAAEARARRVRAVGDAQAHVAIVAATPVATVARHAAREGAALGKPLVSEVRARLLPRVPAVVGLAVGWWVASTFTDSRWSATLHALGIGSGGRRVVSTQQLRAMEFWLPILAAALCSYAGSRIAGLVRARYAPAPDAGDAPEGRAPPATPGPGR